jgi:glycosyltransferase involved in cell wall biosynthesis
MIIAVNTRTLSGDAVTARFLLDSFIAIAAQHPSHEFVFIAEKELAVADLDNVKTLTVKQQSNNPLLWKLWYNYQLPSALRKIKANVLVSLDGICSLRTKLPQCFVINDIEFLQHPEWYQKKHISFARSNTAACLQKAISVISFSEQVKSELSTKYKIAASKIEVIAPLINKKYQPLHWKGAQSVKEKYSNGNEYFLFSGAIHDRSNLMNLLKAFSLFKKRQKSSMQLVITTAAIPEKDPFMENLRLYKYRNEVKVLAGLDVAEVQAITAAAYCSINLSSSIGDINFLLSAMQSQVPVVAGATAVAKEILGAAALYTDTSSPTAIAELLMLVFKDENRHSELMKAGAEQAAKYSADKSGPLLLQKILAAAAQ